MAGNLDAVEKPQSWDKAVASAYLRLSGLTREKAARGAGLGERTLARYEISEWWPKACGEAVGRWMQQLEIEARTTVMAAIKGGDVVTAVKMLERIDPDLAPPRQGHDLNHSGEIDTTPRDMSDEELHARAAHYTNRVAVSTNGNGVKA